MRLTAELINDSLSYINPLKERELDLRGHKIPTLENLAPALANDAIDLTDNAITSLSNFPLFPRLKSLYVARNRVAHIAPDLARNVPNLETLVLTENSIAELADLLPLRECRKLVRIGLGGCPIVGRENYRPFVLFLIPQIRFLDFERVRDVERANAKELFGTFDEPTEAAKKILAVRAGRPLVVGSGVNGDVPEVKRVKTKLTDEERTRYQKLIREAKSLREIERLERMLAEGKVPG